MLQSLLELWQQEQALGHLGMKDRRTRPLTTTKMRSLRNYAS